MQDYIYSLFHTAEHTLQKFLANPVHVQELERLAQALAQCFRQHGKLITFGNGGSMCDAMHCAEELTGRFRHDRPPLPAIALSDPSFLSCAANDFGWEEVFARGVEAYASEGDIVLGISTSGNSPNVIKALTKASELGCQTVALLGKDGGKLKGHCDFEFIVPATTTDRIQEMHIKIIHILIECVENLLFNDLNRK